MLIDDEVTARIAKASVAFKSLRANVWERNGIKLDTKLKAHKAMELPTLLYACETWTVYQHHAKRLNHFLLYKPFDKVVKITEWQDNIPDTEVQKKAGMQSMHALLKLARLRWTDHVIRMPDERLPKENFLWIITRVKTLSMWPEETLQRHTQSLSEGFRHTNRVLGTDFTGAMKLRGLINSR